MAYAQEEGPGFYDQNVYMDDIDNTDLLWINDYREKQILFMVDLDQYAFFRHLQRGLQNDVGVIGFVNLNKYVDDYHCINLHRNTRRRENVHFFINRHDERHLDNIVYSYKTLNENLDAGIHFVFVTNDMPHFVGETIINANERRCTVLRPLGIMGYIDDLILELAM